MVIAIENKLLVQSTTSIPLGANEEFVGSWVEVSQYPAVIASCKADQACTLYMEFTNQIGGTVRSSLPYDVAANINEVHRLTVTRPYFRLRLVNGPIAMTDLDLNALAGWHTSLEAPSNLPIGQDSDSTVVRSLPQDILLGQGLMAGYSKVNKLGKNSDIDGSANEFVTELTTPFLGFTPTIASQLSVSSSSLLDDGVNPIVGTHARSVTIIGLDGNYNTVVETVTLNGLTPVLTTNFFIRSHTFFLRQAGGTPLNSNFNAGTITVTHATSGAILLTMLPGTGSSNYAVYTVPAGKTGYIIRYTAQIRRGTSASADGAFWIRRYGEAPRLRRPFSFAQTSPLKFEIYGGLPLPEKTDVGIYIQSASTNNVSIAAGFDLVIVDN